MTNSQSTTKQKRKRVSIIEKSLLKAVNNVDSVFRGLGMPTALHWVLQKGGISTMTIGTMGTGKGVISDLVQPKDAFAVKLDSVTKTDIAKLFGDVSDIDLHVTIEELASLSDYQRAILTDIMAKVITDRTYVSEASKISIQNCKMTMFCGIQPKTFTQLIAQSSTWESLANDRFVKLLLVNGLRNDDLDRFDDVGKEWKEQVHLEFTNLFRVDIKTVEVKEKALEIIHRLLMNQISGNRARIYARNILRAWASMNGEKIATKALAEKFVKFFGFYFRIFDTFTFREDIGGNLKFKGAVTTTFMAISSNQRFKWTKQDYVAMFRVDESTFRRNTEQLLEMQLIEKFEIPTTIKTKTGKRKIKVDSYRIGGKVEEYFSYYKKITKLK